MLIPTNDVYAQGIGNKGMDFVKEYENKKRSERRQLQPTPPKENNIDLLNRESYQEKGVQEDISFPV